jgi:CMP-2-keto-3-deoxyoctulosonic acid synthetase
VSFTVLVPARLASTRLPNKPLADIAGLPMVVRVAQRASQSGASRVVVAGDDPSIVAACAAHGVQAILTRQDHPSGTDRLAEACEQLGLDGDDIVVNVQGDEPLIDPALIGAVASTLSAHPECAMSTAAHAIDSLDDFLNPNVVKAVLDAQAARPFRGGATAPPAVRRRACCQHLSRCATSASTATAPDSCASFPRSRPPPSKRSRHSNNCVRCGTGTASRCMSAKRRRARASTHPKTSLACARSSQPGQHPELHAQAW